ncbi:hypothetical protein [Vibrio phage vB_VibM_10AMN]|uniref:Uncharacterized protein n=1 Tax=Staphylococcus phage vB_VibM_10AMN12 TaxID=3076785 RepID=A0AA96KSM8_9CAUD|nr:hypothetical protein [Vibrio phage vB_VibM_10AMN]WNO47557.1 hypothetical protein [Staphylococcus phage vB_VibM_10AMN12]
MAKQSAPLHGSVSEDFIEKVADMEFRDDMGEIIPLRDGDGNVKIDLVLYILGFYWYYGETKKEFDEKAADKKTRRSRQTKELQEVARPEGAVYDMLTKDTRYHRNYKSETVFVRNSKRPYEVKEMKVYTGYIRPNYPYKDLYSSGEILVGDFIHGGELKNILDVGDEHSYRQARYQAVSMRQLDDQWDNGMSGEE